MAAKPLLTLCLLGAETEFVEGVARRLENPDPRLRARWDFAPYANADLLLIDTGTVAGHMDWLRAQGSQRRAVAYSESTIDDGSLHLPKPLRTADLVRVLNRTGDEIEQSRTTPPTAAVEAPAPIEVAAPMPPPRIVETPLPPAHAPAPAAPATPSLAVDAQPLPTRTSTPPPVLRPVAPVTSAAPVAEKKRAARTLPGLLADATPSSASLKLEAAGLPTLLLHRALRVWHSDATLKALGAWCARELADADIEWIDEPRFAALAKNRPAHAYARLQWLAELLAHRGELAPGLDAQSRYKLARWPQSEREFPRHFRIATVMLKEAATPHSIAAQSGAALGDVNDFINAYFAIGYIEREAAAASIDVARRGNLLGRLRKGAGAS